MATFFLRHTIYTRIEVATVDGARVASRSIGLEFESALNGSPAVLLEIDHQKDWELQSQVGNDDRPSETSNKKLFCDDFSRRLFEATEADIERASADVLRLIQRDGEVEINDFYDLLGLEPIGACAGLGWKFDSDFGIRIGDVPGAAAYVFFTVPPKNLRDRS